MIAPASQLTADYSYISATANCARFSYYAFERNLAPIGPPPLALHMGTALHVGLDWLYTHDWDIEGAIAAALVAWGDYELPATHKHAYATRGHLEKIGRAHV